MSDYPEHDKLTAIPEAHRDATQEFVEWLESQGIHLMRWDEHMQDERPCDDINCKRGSGQVWNTEAGDYDDCPHCGGLEFVRVTREGWAPAYAAPDAMLAAFYGINRDRLSDEKERMLRALTEASR